MGGLGRRGYRFLKEVTFSLFTKAVMASFWSSVAKHTAKASAS